MNISKEEQNIYHKIASDIESLFGNVPVEETGHDDCSALYNSYIDLLTNDALHWCNNQCDYSTLDLYNYISTLDDNEKDIVFKHVWEIIETRRKTPAFRHGDIRHED